jgi:hypothetical protein
MKRIISAVILIFVLVVIYLLLIRDNSSNIYGVNNKTVEDNNFRPDPSRATFIFDDGPITFSKGKAERKSFPGGIFTEDITITDQIAYGDINNDDRDDAVVIILRSGGASGSFVYLGAFISSSTNYVGTNTVFLGDRILPSSVSIANGRARVEYLDREPDEPMVAEPTVHMVKEFVIRSGKLETI